MAAEEPSFAEVGAEEKHEFDKNTPVETNEQPEALKLDFPGDNAVDAPVVCVITRFGLRRIRDLVGAYLDYRHVVTQAKRGDNPGLLQSAFLVETPRTYCIFSIWSSYAAIPQFGTNVPVHINAARRVFGHIRFGAADKPEVWSTKWNIRSVSNNLAWGDFDLRQWLRTTSPSGHAARASTGGRPSS